MANTIFFAWQLDTPSGQNKDFIWKALQEATTNLVDEAQPELSPRPEKDTEGASGNPNIVQTIFKRIRQCSVFVADLTFVAKTASGKKIPNPNVLLELGYAAKSIGWDRTILVMNSAFGEGIDLPFDILQHRWPIVYQLTERTQVRDKRYESLRDVFIAALQACEEHDLTRAGEMFRALDVMTLEVVAQFEHASILPMSVHKKSLGGHVLSLQYNLGLRRLIDLGALKVITDPNIGYTWTIDGRRMIKQINAAEPSLLEIIRMATSKSNE